MWQNGVSHRCVCVCVKIKYQGGVSHHFGGVLTCLRKYRAIRGIQYCSDSIAISHDMGPLSASFAGKLQKHRGMKSQIVAFRNRECQIAMFLAFINSEDKSKVLRWSYFAYSWSIFADN